MFDDDDDLQDWPLTVCPRCGGPVDSDDETWVCADDECPMGIGGE